jgi:Tol biopolymer transport system component/DNA-binding winged helix-turn-helix (wHTH) protein
LPVRHGPVHDAIAALFRAIRKGGGATACSPFADKAADSPMNYASRNMRAVPAISLAEEEDFSLGPLRVRPSAREASIGDRSETVEPRVMQVLVVLARAAGLVVSREQLIDRCWGGRIVGDDAVNNAIVKVRALAALSEEPAFEIETIPRVGYRLRQRQRDAANAIPVHAAAPVALQGSKPWRWVAAAVAGVAIAAGLIAAVSSYLHREPEWIVAESHQPFISTPAIERYPALAPDGTMLAYSAGPTTHNRHIYLHLLNGGDPIQLTHDAHDASAPAWSPDTRMIAYAIFQADHPCRIMEISVPAGQPRQIGQCHISARSSLAFDPSGRALFFTDAAARGAPDRILRLDLDNGRVSAVTRPGNGTVSDNSPSVSPDGGALLYNRDLGAQGNEIRLLSLSDGSDRLVAAFGDGDTNGTFSADGRTIFISRSLGNDNSLWAYPVQGGEPRRILSTSESIERLSAGPNGLLAMEMEYPFGGQLVAVSPHSNLPPKPIDSGGLRTWCVDYAPDGTFLATGWRAESFGIWISGANGSLRELISLPDRLACAIRWSPDGSRFAYLEWHANRFEVPVMTRDGEPIARFSYPGKDSGRLDWTADGKSILTSRQEKSGWRIWRTDLATPDRSVPVSAFGWRDPRVHGTMLFAEKNGAAGIWRIDGTPHRVTDGPAPEASDVYTIAGDRLIYSDTTDPDHPTFSAQDIHGGTKDRLAPLPGFYIDFVFGIDPKTGDIVYTQRADDTDIGLLRLVKR